MTDQAFWSLCLEEIQEAVQAVYRSDPEPYIALCSHSPPVSLFGALGPCKSSRPDVEMALRHGDFAPADDRATVVLRDKE